MRPIESSAWRQGDMRHTIAALDVLRRSAVSSRAALASLECATARARLTIRFEANDLSPLTVDLRPELGVMSAAFGHAQWFSDYALDVRWLLSLCRAVAEGGWSEHFSRRALIVPCATAVLRVRGKPTTFTAFGSSAPSSVGAARRIDYRSWLTRSAP